MKYILNKIVNLIKYGVVSLVSDDSENIPKCNIVRFEKDKQVYRFSPYGLDTNAPLNSLVLSLQMEGDESSEVAIPQDVQNRMRNLKEGEVVLHNTIAGNYIFLKETGDIDIISTTNVNITSTNINVTGTLNITGSLIINGIDMGTHKHGGVSTGSGTSGVPIN